MREVELTLVVELYDEQRREDQEDGGTMFVPSGVETHLFSMDYGCFNTVDHIWNHIGSRLCAGRPSSTAAYMESQASGPCSSIQQLVHLLGQESPEDEPIQATFTLQLFCCFFPDRQDVSEPTRTIPASKSSVQSLKRKRVVDDNRDDDKLAKKACAICQDEFGKEGSLVALPCDHEFHEKCIVVWLERAHSCPLCRFQLPTD